MNFGNIDIYNFEDKTYIKLNGRYFQLVAYHEGQYDLKLDFESINESVLIGELYNTPFTIAGKEEFLKWLNNL